MVDGGKLFSNLPKVCLSISTGGLTKVWCHLETSLSRSFLSAGVKTLLRHIPIIIHPLSSSYLFLLDDEGTELGTTAVAIFALETNKK
jgi:hypothetical protein